MATDTDVEEMEFYIGQIMPWPGPAATIPAGWIVCAGQLLNGAQGTYEALFSVIGTAYGTGPRTGMFYLPDLVGRIPVGRYAGYSPPASLRQFTNLGNMGGSAGCTFQLPVHSHSISYGLTPSYSASTVQGTTAALTSGTPAVLASCPPGTPSDAQGNFNIYLPESSDPIADVFINGAAIRLDITIATAGNGISSGVTVPFQGPYMPLNYIICFSGRYPAHNTQEG